MVETFRKLGLPVDLKNGKVTLTENYNICKNGQILTPEQCRILKYFDHKLAPFALKVLCYYNNGNVVNMDK